MKRSRQFIPRALFTVAMMATLSIGVVGRGEEGENVLRPPGGNQPGMALFYGGALIPVATFPGKLVCLRCDLAPSRDAAKTCAKEGHVHALSMDDGSMIHPLLAGTPEILVQINSAELHDKEVKVHGRHYVSTGMILVDNITPVE